MHQMNELHDVPSAAEYRGAVLTVLIIPPAIIRMKSRLNLRVLKKPSIDRTYH